MAAAALLRPTEAGSSRTVGTRARVSRECAAAGRALRAPVCTDLPAGVTLAPPSLGTVHRVLTAGGGVGFLASAPGGCILASTDAVTLLLLPLTGAVEATLTGQTGGVRAACVLSDGSNRVLTGSGSEHAVVCLHDLSVARVGIRSVARGGIRSVARGGIKPVARGGIRLSPRRTFIGRDSVPRVAMCGLGAGTVRAIVELSGGRFAGACYNGIFVWAMHSGVRLTTLSGHTGAVHALAAADDHTLVSSGYDKTLRLWDTRSYTCVASVPAPSIVLALLRLIDGTLASGHDDGVVRLWYTRCLLYTSPSPRD